MSSGFSANQYDTAFRSQRLQNWCVAKSFKERPTAQKGHTTFIANNKGHLLPGAAKKGSAWPDFKGTWDYPDRIPAHPINPTSRSAQGLRRLKAWGLDPQQPAGTKAPVAAAVASGPELPVQPGDPQVEPAEPPVQAGEPTSD